MGGLLVLLLPMVLPIAMLVACAGGLAAALALSRWSFYRQEERLLNARPDFRQRPGGSARSRGPQRGIRNED